VLNLGFYALVYFKLLLFNPIKILSLATNEPVLVGIYYYFIPTIVAGGF